MGSIKIDVSERRARLGRHHHLCPESHRPDPLEVARGIVAYHATDPASVYLSAAARTAMAAPATLDQALYEDRTLVRTLGMRRTMFVVPTDQLPVIQAACTDPIASRERKRTLQMLSDAGVSGDVERWLADAEAATVRALEVHGEATTRQLGDDVPALRHKLVLSPGKPYEANATIGPRVLFQLSAEGKVVRGRPVKSWVSNYRWTLTSTWLAGEESPMHPAAAESELARQWLAAFGPGTVNDLKWWTGWTLGTARRTLAELGAVEVELDGGETGFVLPGDTEPVAAPEPWVALLPGLDPTVMGWAMAGRHWYLGENCRAAVYDRNGNIGPTVWWDGRVVGAWAQRRDGQIAYRVIEDVGSAGRAAVAEAAARLEGWLGDVRVTPRFRTPLEKQLSA